MCGVKCTGSNKLLVPNAEIDRPIVDPKGTWSIKPTIKASVAVQDSSASRSITLGNWLFPSYSLTNNLSLPFIPFPYLVWQLTKSPLVDTTAIYKWQFALSGGMTGYSRVEGVSGDMQFSWKKRLSPSTWYLGSLAPFFIGHNAWMGAAYGIGGFGIGPLVNGVGFQLSPKADVITMLSLGWPPDSHSPPRNPFSGTGSFAFHYSFSPWFAINVGAALREFESNGLFVDGTNIELNIGSEIYW
jgi:hypothetical protein